MNVLGIICKLGNRSLVFGKKWRDIDSQDYCEKILFLIHGNVSVRYLFVMQDNAPAYVVERTMEEMIQRLIFPIFWPPNSTDLNPIEVVLGMIKCYIHLNHSEVGGGKQRSHESLRKSVKKAWGSVSPENLVRLLESISSSYQAVTDVDEGPTKY